MLLSATCEDDCTTNNQFVEDLIEVYPQGNIYEQGDIITLQLVIPSLNDYFGEGTNLLESTNDIEAEVILRFDDLFSGNELTFIRGEQGTHQNKFIIPYYEDSDSYELIFQVTLNKLGYYSIHSSSNDISFSHLNSCNDFHLETTISGLVPPYDLTFSVIE